MDKQQRTYENRIRQLKQEERQLRACGMEKEAKALRKKWRILTKDYQIYSIEHDRAYYPYRYVIDRSEEEQKFELQEYLDKAQRLGHKKQESILTNYKNQFIIEQERLREPTDFVLARTVREAEQYMARRVVNVSYNGITNIKSLNQANRTFAYLFDKYELNVLGKISTNISTRNKKALAETTGNLLNISKEFANNPLNKDVVCSAGKEKWLSYLRNKIQEATGKIERHSDNNKFVKKTEKYIQMLENLKKYSRGNVFYEGREVESVLTHEIGHIIAEQKFQQLSKEFAMGGNAEKIRTAFKKAKDEGDIYNISAYANTDSKEFFAECFTIYELGEEKLPDYIQELMEEILK